MNHQIQAYLKNDLFEGIIGKEDYLALYNEDMLDKFNTVLISIHEPDNPLHPTSKLEGFKDVLQIQFWDIESEFGNYKPITSGQGKILREFIEKHKTSKFLIHCAAGQSRSAGVGCAVECIVNFNGDLYSYATGGPEASDIKQHPRYSPNYTVFDNIISDEE